jgi:hypothetical protein
MHWVFFQCTDNKICLLSVSDAGDPTGGAYPVMRTDSRGELRGGHRKCYMHHCERWWLHVRASRPKRLSSWVWALCAAAWPYLVRCRGQLHI